MPPKATEKLVAEMASMSAELIDLQHAAGRWTPKPSSSRVKKTGRCVTVEEGWPICSVSSEIAKQVQEKAFDWLDAPILSITGKDVPMPYAANLEVLAKPSVPELIEAVKAVCYK